MPGVGEHGADAVVLSAARAARVLGAGEAVVVPATYRWIRYNFAEKQRGLAMGLYMTGTKLGPAIGAPVAAWLIVSYDWRNMFLILGLGCLVWLVPWMLLVKNDDTVEDLLPEIVCSEKVPDYADERTADQPVAQYLRAERRAAERSREKVAAAIEKGMLEGVFIFRVPSAIVDGGPATRGLDREDLRGAGQPAPLSVFLVDDVETQ